MGGVAERLLVKAAGQQLPNQFALAPYVGRTVILSTTSRRHEKWETHHTVGKLVGFVLAPLHKTPTLTLWIAPTGKGEITIHPDDEFTIELAPSFEHVQ